MKFGSQTVFKWIFKKFFNLLNCHPVVKPGHHLSLGIPVGLGDLFQLDVLVALLEAAELGLVKHLAAVQLLI